MSRSFLFVPADSDRKLDKARGCDADALILDLEDSVASNRKQEARDKARAFLESGDISRVWIRINPLTTVDAERDLQAVMPAGPAGIVLPKPESAADAQQLAAMLDDLERQHSIAAGSTRVLPIVTEKPIALFRLDGYVDCTGRLSALSWGAEDLSTELGAATNRDDDGNWLPAYEMARSMCLFAAAAAEVAAIDTVFSDFRDGASLKRYAARARRDGFSGMLAIHPDQVATINQAFTPSPGEIDWARRVTAAFAAAPDAGVLALNGKMLDRPHLLQARKILAMAGDNH